jgi:hypothetical protein
MDETAFGSEIERAYWLEVQELRRLLSRESLKRLGLEQENHELKQMMRMRNARLGAMGVQQQAGGPLNS